MINGWFRLSNVPTPKQPQSEQAKDWYPYYAGFSTAFVDRTLADHFVGARSLIDPWNGSGTTTAIGAASGLRCVGIDVNPAVTVIARARLTPMSLVDSLSPIAEEIVVASRRELPVARESEPLQTWLRKPAVDSLRRLQRGIHRVVVGDDDLELEVAGDPGSTTENLPLLCAFFYSALFLVARDLLKPFRSSNPSWVRPPESFRHRVNPTSGTVEGLFKNRVEYLARRLSLPSESASAWTKLRTDSVLNLADVNEYDACLTSPPYATRLDYVKMTLPELSVLGLDTLQIEELRRLTTGTPVVRDVDVLGGRLTSPLANEIVLAVKQHPSHGSANYYAPWIENYLRSLQTSLFVIDQAVVHRGHIGVVVQDSHYKSIHIDLQTIVVQTMEAAGRSMRNRADFPVRHSIARMNPAARKHHSRPKARESLLLFS